MSVKALALGTVLRTCSRDALSAHLPYFSLPYYSQINKETFFSSCPRTGSDSQAYLKASPFFILTLMHFSVKVPVDFIHYRSIKRAQPTKKMKRTDIAVTISATQFSQFVAASGPITQCVPESHQLEKGQIVPWNLPQRTGTLEVLEVKKDGAPKGHVWCTLKKLSTDKQ